GQRYRRMRLQHGLELFGRVLLVLAMVLASILYVRLEDPETLASNVRLVPGGSSIRRGAYVAPGVVMMPPAYINVGAWVGAGTMVDSHALVGSCAQIGERVHLSAAAQVGGVLEPAGARPVVVEDDCFVGALSGLFEGVVVRRRAVLAPGVILTGSTVLFDLVKGRELRGEVPEGAVVVPGSRPARGDYATTRGICLYAPCIVKYRDADTNAATALEEALR
ncbi:MAG: 2,3,4,5-tetrahydropyridine-2,6-dicarboxylate N-succinyltransferase, partial [Spirochaetota bacterium]